MPKEGLTPTECTLRARAAAYAMHSKGLTNTEPARKAFLAKFEDQVDPNRELPDAERLRRAELARKAHMTKLAYQAVKARRLAKAGDAS